MFGKLVCVFLFGAIMFFSDARASDGYPYKSVCPTGDRYFDGKDSMQCGDSGCFLKDRWNFAQCNCTSYAAYRLNLSVGDFDNSYKGEKWSHGGHWDDAAHSAGLNVDKKPVAGDVAYWNPVLNNSSMADDYGHVAVVDKVEYGDDDKVVRVFVSEYNGKHALAFASRSFTPGSNDWLDNPDGYIHFQGVVRKELLSVGNIGWYPNYMPCIRADEWYTLTFEDGEAYRLPTTKLACWNVKYRENNVDYDVVFGDGPLTCHK